MKRNFTALLLCTAFLFQVTPPANAVFGLSTCERVKKKVLDYEKKINAAAKEYKVYENRSAPVQIEKDLIAYREANWIGGLIKITYNNPKCFTRTQMVEINLRKKADVDSSQFLSWYKRAVPKMKKSCQWNLDDPNSFRTLREGDPCFWYWDLRIKAYSVKSIYDY